MYTEEEKEQLLIPDFIPVRKKAFHYIWRQHMQKRFHLLWDQDEREWTIWDRLEDDFYTFLEEIKETTVIRAPVKYIEDLGDFSNKYLALWDRSEKSWTVPVLFADAARTALGVNRPPEGAIRGQKNAKGHQIYKGKNCPF